MKITIDLTSFQVRVLESNMLDIQVWLQNAIDNKLRTLMNQVVLQEINRRMNDPAIDSIPADSHTLIEGAPLVSVRVMNEREAASHKPEDEDEQ